MSEIRAMQRKLERVVGGRVNRLAKGAVRAQSKSGKVRKIAREKRLGASSQIAKDIGRVERGKVYSPVPSGPMSSSVG